MLRVFVVVLPLLVACRSSDPPETPSPQADPIRAAWAAQLTILSRDDSFAVARSERRLFAFARRGDGAWRLEAELPIPPDWRTAVRSGFSTYVDDDRLRSAYARYLQWCRDPQSTPPLSDRSLLAAKPMFDEYVPADDLVVVGPRDWSRLALRCVGCEGRYAWIVVTHLARVVTCDYGVVVTRAADRLVVLRADDGKEWLVDDEAMLDDGE